MNLMTTRKRLFFIIFHNRKKNPCTLDTTLKIKRHTSGFSRKKKPQIEDKFLNGAKKIRLRIKLFIPA